MLYTEHYKLWLCAVFGEMRRVFNIPNVSSKWGSIYATSAAFTAVLGIHGKEKFE